MPSSMRLQAIDSDACCRTLRYGNYGATRFGGSAVSGHLTPINTRTVYIRMQLRVLVSSSSLYHFYPQPLGHSPASSL